MFAVAHLVFGIPLPAHPLGFLAAIAAGTSAVFALGLVIAAVAPRARTATGAGTVLFLLVMFFAGVYLPKFLLPDVVLRIGEYVPPGSRRWTTRGSAYVFTTRPPVRQWRRCRSATNSPRSSH